MKVLDALIIAGVIVVVGAILWPVNSVQRPAGSVICLSNVKNLALGLVMYADDHNDRLPEGAKWFDRESSYIKLKSLPRCPAFNDPERGGYAFNSNLSQASLSKPKQPDRIPMVYDSNSLGPQPNDPFNSLPNPGRHQGKNSIAFADGHARALTNEQAKTMHPTP